VGKSKLIERFLLDDYHPRQRSTFALTLYRHSCDVVAVPRRRASAAASNKEGGGGVERREEVTYNQQVTEGS
jgi:hypothetical protein